MTACPAGVNHWAMYPSHASVDGLIQCPACERSDVQTGVAVVAGRRVRIIQDHECL